MLSPFFVCVAFLVKGKAVCEDTDKGVGYRQRRGFIYSPLEGRVGGR